MEEAYQSIDNSTKDTSVQKDDHVEDQYLTPCSETVQHSINENEQEKERNSYIETRFDAKI